MTVVDYRIQVAADIGRDPGEPDIVWVITHEGLPIQAQAFMGAWEGREGSYWIPAARFTTTLEHTYQTRSAACGEARRRLALKRVALDQLEKKIADVERGGDQ